MTINTLLVVVLQQVYVETLAKKLSNVKGFLFGCLIMAFSCFAYVFADRAPMWFGIIAVYTIGEVLQNPKFSGLTAQTAKQVDPSLYYSIIGTAGRGGVAIMPIIGGMLLGVHHSLLFLFMGGLLLLAMVLSDMRRQKPAKKCPFKWGKSERCGGEWLKADGERSKI